MGISTVIVIFLFYPLIAQKIEKKDGGTTVKNPKNPLKVPGGPLALVLEEDLRIGVESGDEDYMFASIRSVQVDNEEDIIVLDWKYNVIKVFDKTGKHIRTFGKHGQGPGEIQSPSRMYLKGGKDIGILDNANNRFSYFSKDGKCLKELALVKYRPSWVMPDSKGYSYGDTFYFEKKIKFVLYKYDQELNPVKTITEFERNASPGSSNPFMERLVYQVTADDHFIWANNYEYLFHILDPSGNEIKIVSKDVDPTKISEKGFPW
jgi:hypothetical protein